MRAMRTLPLATLAAAAVVVSACGGGVTVRKAGVSAPPRQAGCELEVLRAAPERPHDALADLEAHVTRVPSEGALAVVTPRACALGADAIVVQRNMVLNEQGHVLVAVTAIKYRPFPAEAGLPGPPTAGDRGEQPKEDRSR